MLADHPHALIGENRVAIDYISRLLYRQFGWRVLSSSHSADRLAEAFRATMKALEGELRAGDLGVWVWRIRPEVVMTAVTDAFGQVGFGYAVRWRGCWLDHRVGEHKVIDRGDTPPPGQFAEGEVPALWPRPTKEG